MGVNQSRNDELHAEVQKPTFKKLDENKEDGRTSLTYLTYLAQ